MTPRSPRSHTFWMLWFAFLALGNAYYDTPLIACLMIVLSTYSMFQVWADLRRRAAQ